MAADEVHCDKPLAKGYLGVLENRSEQDREIRLAVRAMEAPVCTADAVVLTAERTNNVLLIPPGFKNSLAALVLGIEVLSESENGVEMCEVNHIAQVLRFIYLFIPQTWTFLTQKTILFSTIFQKLTGFWWTTGISIYR